MATTVSSSPQEISPSGNNLIWVFSSSQSVQPNFSFIVEVVLNGTIIGTHQVFLENLNFAKFNAQVIIDAALSYKSQIINETLITVLQQLSKVHLNIKEKYGTTPIVQSTISTTDIYCYKGSLSLSEFVGYDFNNFVAANTSKRFLTEAKKINNYGTFGIFFKAPPSTVIYYLNVRDDKGTFYSTPIFTGNTNDVLMFVNINNTTLLGLGAPQFQIDIANFYDIWISDKFPIPEVIVSETLRVFKENKCKNFQNKLTFINRYSIPEQFVFTQHERKSFNASSSSYEKRQGEWVGNDFIVNTINSGLSPIQTTRDGTIELFSEILSPKNAAYLLEEINSSPLIVLNDNMLFIVASSFEIPNINDDAKQIIVKGKISNTYVSNRI